MYDFIIIGGGQAGLAMAYYLTRQKRKFVVLDKGTEIGFSWLERWDSLRLFTPVEFNHLPGMDFPLPKDRYPSKYEVAQYFKSYAQKFELPVLLQTLVTQVQKTDDKFVLSTNREQFESKAVIVATGPFHLPYIPSFSSLIAEDIFQLHSNSYKNPQQLQEGAVLVVGDGDSGYQITDELSQDGFKTYFSGSTKVRVLPQEILGKTLWWWFEKTGFLNFNRDSKIGNYLRKRKQPLIGTPARKICRRKNVEVVGRTLHAEHNLIKTEKKELRDVRNIIWATGYKPNFEWIEGLRLDSDGYPVQYRGVSELKNLFFIGLPWLYTRGSATLGGVKKDAEYLDRYLRENFGWKRFGRLGFKR